MNGDARYEKEERYFAASNSEHGFHSYYSEVFGAEDIKELYVITGGPGTGKSRFMRDVATCGSSGGYDARYYYCSSDANSLDGIIMESAEKQIKLAVIDGTAPHTYVPRLPGAVERTVDLGAFWNADELAKYKRSLAGLNREKSACFESAYRYLGAAGKVGRNIEAMSEKIIMTEKMKKAAQRYMKFVPQGDGFCAIPALNVSVGMTGTVRFDTYERMADELYIISDYANTAHFMTRELFGLARERGQTVYAAYDPVFPERIDALFIKQTGTAFVISGASALNECECAAEHKTVNMRRFADPVTAAGLKREMSEAERQYCGLLDSAVKCLKEAAKYHFAIEDIYIANMDFPSKEKFTQDFCDRLFDR